MWKLILVVPGKSFLFEINEWTPINEQPFKTEIGIAIIDEQLRATLKNALDYYSIRAELLENGLLLLDMPSRFVHDPLTNELYLNYS